MIKLINKSLSAFQRRSQLADDTKLRVISYSVEITVTEADLILYWRIGVYYWFMTEVTSCRLQTLYQVKPGNISWEGTVTVILIFLTWVRFDPKIEVFIKKCYYKITVFIWFSVFTRNVPLIPIYIYIYIYIYITTYFVVFNNNV